MLPESAILCWIEEGVARTTVMLSCFVQRVNNLRTYFIVTAFVLALTLSPPVAEILIPLPYPAQDKISNCGPTSQYFANLLHGVDIRTIYAQTHR